MVIGSQCGGLPNLPLSFLPDAAKDLYAVLVDPERGGCDPDASRLVLDPELSAMAAAMSVAVAAADAAEATLLLAFIGHGVAVDNDLYLLPTNGTPEPTMYTGLLFGQSLSELVRTANGLDGLILLVDSCQSGKGVADLAQRASSAISAGGLRVQLVTSTFDQAARDGCFTRTLTRLLREGVPGLSRDYLLADNDVIARIASDCTAQEPPRTAMFQGRWRVNDPGLFLGRNAAARDAWVLAGTAAGGQAVDLTQHFQVTDALDQVVDRWRTHRVVGLSGGPGTGKSAVVAALARPEVAPDVVLPGLMAGVAFAETSVDVVGLAQGLAVQLARLPGFLAAADRYVGRFHEEELNLQDALTRLVVGPLQEMTVTGTQRVRVAVDGLDQLQESDRSVLFAAVRTLSSDPDLSGVRVVLAGRPHSLPDFGPEQAVVKLGDAPGVAELREYLGRRNVPAAAVPAIAAHASSWLDARLLADLAASVHAARFDASLEAPSSVDVLYEWAIAEARTRSDSPVLVDAALDLLGAAGSGPVLPLGLLAEALGEAGSAVSEGQARDLLVRLGGLVVRAKPGTPEESVGLVHDTLQDHLSDGSQAETFGIHRGHAWILGVLERDAERESPKYAAHSKTAKADHLWAVSRWAEALAWVQDSLGHRPADNLAALRPWLDRCTHDLGPDHPDTLALRGELASWTGRAGDVVAARDMSDDLVADQTRVLGPDHRDTLTTRSNVAWWTAAAGDAAGAWRLGADLLADQERVLGPVHADTLITRSNLASWAGEAGNAAGARDLYALLLAEWTRALGPDHPHTLTTRNNLALWTAHAGDAARARDLLAALLPDQARVLGPEHPDTLTTRNNLASLTGEAGNAEGARDLFAALVAQRIDTLGMDHPGTLVARNNLAHWTGVAGNSVGARDLFAALLQDRTSVLGPDHPDTLATRNNLATWTGEAGDAVAARDLLAALLPDHARVLGYFHAATLTTRNNLAVSTGLAGDAPQARDELEELIQDRSRVLGPDHPDTLITRGHFATWTGRAGDATGARDLFAALLRDRTRVLGPDHPATLNTRKNLAYWTEAAVDDAIDKPTDGSDD